MYHVRDMYLEHTFCRCGIVYIYIIIIIICKEFAPRLGFRKHLLKHRTFPKLPGHNSVGGMYYSISVLHRAPCLCRRELSDNRESDCDRFARLRRTQERTQDRNGVLGHARSG